jgi:hypothetical protein
MEDKHVRGILRKKYNFRWERGEKCYKICKIKNTGVSAKTFEPNNSVDFPADFCEI